MNSIKMNTAPEITETKYLNSIFINLSLCNPLCWLYSQEGPLQVAGRMVCILPAAPCQGKDNTFFKIVPTETQMS